MNTLEETDEEYIKRRTEEVKSILAKMPQRVIDQEREYLEKKEFANKIFGDFVKELEEIRKSK